MMFKCKICSENYLSTEALQDHQFASHTPEALEAFGITKQTETKTLAQEWQTRSNENKTEILHSLGYTPSDINTLISLEFYQFGSKIKKEIGEALIKSTPITQKVQVVESDENKTYQNMYDSYLKSRSAQIKKPFQDGVESKASEVNGDYIVNGMVIGKVTDFEPNNWFGKVELFSMPEFAEYGDLDPQAVVKGDNGVTYKSPRSGHGTLFDDDGNPTVDVTSFESKASETHIWGEWFSDNFKEEYTMDQDGTYRCRHCGAWFDMYMHSQEVAKYHLAEHGIVIGESKANEEIKYDGYGNIDMEDGWSQGQWDELDADIDSMNKQDEKIKNWREQGFTDDEIRVKLQNGESKANENKTYTCDKCGKVGDSFSGMAQEECPADSPNNHQIPIFGDQVKPRGHERYGELLQAQKRILDDFKSSNPNASSIDDVPYDIYEKLEQIKDSEFLYNAVDQYMWAGEADYGNKWNMMTPEMRRNHFERVVQSGIHFNEDDEQNWADYNYGDVEWSQLTQKMQDQLKSFGITEAKATEDDYKYDFDELTSLAQAKIEDEGVTQKEWDETPEEERKDLEDSIGEALKSHTDYHKLINSTLSGETTIQCSKCSKKFKAQESLDIHYNDTHADSELKSLIGELKANEEIEYTGGDFCDKCGTEFEDRGECKKCNSQESDTAYKSMKNDLDTLKGLGDYNPNDSDDGKKVGMSWQDGGESDDMSDDEYDEKVEDLMEEEGIDEITDLDEEEKKDFFEDVDDIKVTDEEELEGEEVDEEEVDEEEVDEEELEGEEVHEDMTEEEELQKARENLAPLDKNQDEKSNVTKAFESGASIEDIYSKVGDTTQDRGSEDELTDIYNKTDVKLNLEKY